MCAEAPGPLRRTPAERRAAALALWSALALGGCSFLPPAPQPMFRGTPPAASPPAAIAFGGEILNVLAVDGHAVAAARPGLRRPTLGLLVLPGQHVLDVAYIWAPIRQGYIYETTKGQIGLQAEAGHKYIPRVSVNGDEVHFWIEDKGVDYPPECLSEAAYTDAYEHGSPHSGC